MQLLKGAALRSCTSRMAESQAGYKESDGAHEHLQDFVFNTLLSPCVTFVWQTGVKVSYFLVGVKS